MIFTEPPLQLSSERIHEYLDQVVQGIRPSLLGLAISLPEQGRSYLRVELASDPSGHPLPCTALLSRTMASPRSQSSDLHRKLDRFAAYYNQRRVHAGLAGRTPFERCGTTACGLANLHHFAWRSDCSGLFHTPIAA